LFRRSLQHGESGERAFTSLLDAAGIPYRRNGGLTISELAGWDVEFGDPPVTAEVKYDRMQARTGNVAVEFYNPKSGRASGISATSAAVWVYVFDLPRAVYAISADRLSRFTASEPPFRVVPVAGDDNASIKLFRSGHILPLFTRLDDVPPVDLAGVIAGVIHEVP
jgi:hypothetical protein